MYLTHGQPYLFCVLISDNTNSVCILCAESVWREFGLHGSLRSKGDVRSRDMWLTHSNSSSCQRNNSQKSDWNQIQTIWFTSQMSEKLWVFEMTHKYRVLVSGQDKPWISGDNGSAALPGLMDDSMRSRLLLESQWPNEQYKDFLQEVHD